MLDRLLITGAAGKLGCELRRTLPPLCRHLRLSDRDTLGEAAAHEELMPCDLADAEAVMALLRDVDMVVHLGGVSVEDRFDALLQSNIVGLYNLFEAARKNGVARVVWASSNHAIGFYRRRDVIDTDCPTRPDSNYGVSKVFGEAVAQYYWDKFGLEAVSVRIGTCLPEPADRRSLATWLSYPDFTRLITACLRAPKVAHSIIYGVSNNDERVWDNRLAAHIGFRPQDNAEAFRQKIEAAAATSVQDDPDLVLHGGKFARAGHFEDGSH